MNIGLVHKNNRYGFVIISKDNKPIFDSFCQNSLVPFVKDSYKYAWQAQKHAKKMLKSSLSILRYSIEDLNKPITTDISAEEMLSNHYMNIYDGIEDKTHGIKGASEKEREMVFQELKMIRDELEVVIGQIEDKQEKSKMKRILMLYRQLIRKYFKSEDDKSKREEEKNPTLPSMPPSAPEGGAPPVLASIIDPSSDNMRVIEGEVKSGLMDFYGEMACKAIERRHSGAHYVVHGKEGDEVIIFDEENSPLIYLGVNDRLNVSRIIPMKKVKNIYPYHSVDFYQKYFKPIIEEIGHFYVDDDDTIILPSLASLPDTPKGIGCGKVRGWNVKSKKPKALEISFRGNDPCWFIENVKAEKFASNSSSRYTENEYLNSIVKCTDPKLESIYGRTGAVIQVIPNEDMIELDVDFGRGIGVVRITESQIEIVPV